MGRKARQFLILIISLLILISLSYSWLYMNKKSGLDKINMDKDLEDMLFHKGLGILVIMSFIYFVVVLIALITGVKLKIIGG